MNIVERNDLGEALVPQEWSKEILQSAPQSSVVLRNARVQQMSRKTRVQPVLDMFPSAYWVNGDTGLKETAKQTWGDIKMVAEELAVIVPVPEAVLADSDIDVFGEIAPRVSESFGQAIDKAVLFGEDKPSSWADDIFTGAQKAGNTIEVGTNNDVAADVAVMGESLAKEGYEINGFVSQPGFDWQLRGLRADSGTPIYVDSIAGSSSANLLYGKNIDTCNNGGWDATKATLIGADWNNILLGIRQDLTYKVLDQAVITDSAGKVVLNLAQQDSVALRFVLRCGFVVANPLNRVEEDATKRYPAYVLTPKAASQPEASQPAASQS